LLLFDLTFDSYANTVQYWETTIRYVVFFVDAEHPQRTPRTLSEGMKMRAIFVAVGVLYGVHFAFAAGKAKSPSAKASSIAKPAAVVAPPRAPQEVEREGVKLMDQVSV